MNFPLSHLPLDVFVWKILPYFNVKTLIQNYLTLSKKFHQIICGDSFSRYICRNHYIVKFFTNCSKLYDYECSSQPELRTDWIEKRFEETFGNGQSNFLLLVFLSQIIDPMKCTKGRSMIRKLTSHLLLSSLDSFQNCYDPENAGSYANKNRVQLKNIFNSFFRKETYIFGQKHIDGFGSLNIVYVAFDLAEKKYFCLAQDEVNRIRHIFFLDEIPKWYNVARTCVVEWENNAIMPFRRVEEVFVREKIIDGYVFYWSPDFSKREDEELTCNKRFYEYYYEGRPMETVHVYESLKYMYFNNKKIDILELYYFSLNNIMITKSSNFYSYPFLLTDEEFLSKEVERHVGYFPDILRKEIEQNYGKESTSIDSILISKLKKMNCEADIILQNKDIILHYSVHDIFRKAIDSLIKKIGNESAVK